MCYSACCIWSIKKHNETTTLLHYSQPTDQQQIQTNASLDHLIISITGYCCRGFVTTFELQFHKIVLILFEFVFVRHTHDAKQEGNKIEVSYPLPCVAIQYSTVHKAKKSHFRCGGRPCLCMTDDVPIMHVLEFCFLASA